MPSVSKAAQTEQTIEVFQMMIFRNTKGINMPLYYHGSFLCSDRNYRRIGPGSASIVHLADRISPICLIREKS